MKNKHIINPSTRNFSLARMERNIVLITGLLIAGIGNANAQSITLDLGNNSTCIAACDKAGNWTINEGPYTIKGYDSCETGTAPSIYAYKYIPGSSCGYGSCCWSESFYTSVSCTVKNHNGESFTQTRASGNIDIPRPASGGFATVADVKAAIKTNECPIAVDLCKKSCKVLSFDAKTILQHTKNYITFPTYPIPPTPPIPPVPPAEKTTEQHVAEIDSNGTFKTKVEEAINAMYHNKIYDPNWIVK